MNRGYFLFTSAIGGEIPCWSPLETTASVPPLTRAVATDDPISGTRSVDAGFPTNIDDEESSPTLAVNNVVFSRHYPVDDPKALSVGAYIGIGLGVSIPVSAVISALTYYWLRKRRQKKEKAKARVQTYRNSFPGIWDGPHSSQELLYRGPPQELNTFKTSTVDRMAAARTRDEGYGDQQAQRFDQTRQSFEYNSVVRGNRHNRRSRTLSDAEGFVQVPLRVSSRSATVAGYASPLPISSTRTGPAPVNDTGNPWGGAVDSKGIVSKEGLDTKSEKPKGGKEEEALRDAVGASASAAGGSSRHGTQQQRQSRNPPELAGHPVVGHDGRESGDGYNQVEGYHEPPPEYRE